MPLEGPEMVPGFEDRPWLNPPNKPPIPGQPGKGIARISINLALTANQGLTELLYAGNYIKIESYTGNKGDLTLFLSNKRANVTKKFPAKRLKTINEVFIYLYINSTDTTGELILLIGGEGAGEIETESKTGAPITGELTEIGSGVKKAFTSQRVKAWVNVIITDMGTNTTIYIGNATTQKYPFTAVGQGIAKLPVENVDEIYLLGDNAADDGKAVYMGV